MFVSFFQTEMSVLNSYIIAIKMQFITIPMDPTPVLANLDSLEMGSNAKVNYVIYRLN